MAVSTESLQVRRVIVPTITVYVVYIQLAAMFRDKAAMQAGILLMNRVRVFILHTVTAIDFSATVSSRQRLGLRVS